MIKLKTTKGYGQGAIKFCIFGATGTEKTRLIRTAESPIIFNAEKGLLSISDTNFPFADIDSLKDFKDAQEWVLNSKEAEQFKTICFDSLSGIAEIVLSCHLPNFKNDMQAYKQTQEDILNFLGKMRNQNRFNIYYTAKQVIEKDVLSGYVIERPLLPGKVLCGLVEHYLDGLFQTVTHTDKSSGETFISLKTFTNEKSFCKDRTGALDAWEQMNLSNIYQKINAKFNNNQ